MKPRAMLTRCCSPPENVAGASPHSRCGTFRRRSMAAARSRASPASMPAMRSGSATTSSADTRGITRRNWLT